MKLILITPPYYHPHENEILGIACDIGIDKIHIRKPNADLGILKTYLDSLGERIIEISSLHYYGNLIEKYAFQNYHMSSFQRKKILNEYKHIPNEYNTKISTSFHSTHGIRKEGKGFDYCFCSPVFESISKPSYTPAIHWDLSILQHQAELNQYDEDLEFFALGGITKDNVEKSKQRGFHGVAILGTIWKQETKESAITELKNIKSICDQLS